MRHKPGVRQPLQVGLPEVLEENVAVHDVVHLARVEGGWRSGVISRQPLLDLREGEGDEARRVTVVSQVRQSHGLPTARPPVQNKPEQLTIIIIFQPHTLRLT